jgi:hypothetical protein
MTAKGEFADFCAISIFIGADLENARNNFREKLFVYRIKLSKSDP